MAKDNVHKGFKGKPTKAERKVLGRLDIEEDTPSGPSKRAVQRRGPRYYPAPVHQGMGNWDYTERAMGHFMAFAKLDEAIRRMRMPDGEEKLTLEPDVDSPTGMRYAAAEMSETMMAEVTKEDPGEVRVEANIHKDSMGEVFSIEEMFYGHRVTRADGERWKNGSDPHRFEAEQRVAALLEETESEWRPVRLPYPATFLDCRLIEGKKTYYGILAHELVSEYQEGFPLIFVNALYWHDESPNVGHLHFMLPVHPDAWRKGSRDYKHSVRTVTRWLMNFIFLLDHPKVKKVKVTRSPKADARRRKAKKRPMPPTTRIRLRGELRLYADQIAVGRRLHYSHSFWVRGHWRHLVSPKWTNKQGEHIWIPPYVKGEGILIDKRYDLDPAWLKKPSKPGPGRRRRGPQHPEPEEME